VSAAKALIKYEAYSGATPATLLAAKAIAS